MVPIGGWLMGLKVVRETDATLCSSINVELDAAQLSCFTISMGDMGIIILWGGGSIAHSIGAFLSFYFLLP